MNLCQQDRRSRRAVSPGGWPPIVALLAGGWSLYLQLAECGGPAIRSLGADGDTIRVADPALRQPGASGAGIAALGEMPSTGDRGPGGAG